MTCQLKSLILGIILILLVMMGSPVASLNMVDEAGYQPFLVIANSSTIRGEHSGQSA